MIRSVLEYDDVVNAINKIVDDNGKITISAIRQVIGGGNVSLIGKYLKLWKESVKSSAVKQDDKSIADGSEKFSNNCAKDDIKQSGNDEDAFVKNLMDSSSELSDDILISMSEEWDVILKESNSEKKCRKLYASLVKEQIRRETAEKIAEEAKNYADSIKEQISQRISDLRSLLEEQISFLNVQISQLKKEAETDLEYYRSQLEKVNRALSKVCK